MQGTAFCVLPGSVILFFVMFHLYTRSCAEHKGKEVSGLLLGLEVYGYGNRGEHGLGGGTGMKYAVVNINGKTKNFYLLYNEWYLILKEYIGKEIPLKIYVRAGVIDFAKIYSELI